MPNWCSNKLKIKSHLKIKESLVDFWKWIGADKPISFEKILPTPKLKNKIAWREKNWGIKYDVSPLECFKSQSSENIEFSFVTAWKPPILGIISLSSSFPDLTFELSFSEPKKNLGGSAKIRRGELEEITSYGGAGLTGLLSKHSMVTDKK